MISRGFDQKPDEDAICFYFISAEIPRRCQNMFWH